MGKSCLFQEKNVEIRIIPEKNELYLKQHNCIKCLLILSCFMSMFTAVMMAVPLLEHALFVKLFFKIIKMLLLFFVNFGL